MRAWTIDRYGDDGVLALTELPTPPLAPDEIRIAVRAASVNPLDLKVRAGDLRRLGRDRFPLVLGNDVSGVVVETGSAVADLTVGDEVFARLEKHRMGGFAEQVVLPAAIAARKPTSLSHEQAAAVPLAALTAWQALTDGGPLRPGGTVLIHAGSGGVGTFAVQLARHLGATVATTAGTRNFALLRKLGADTVIDYRTESFTDRVRDADLVLDSQGGQVLRRSFRVLRRGGQLVTIGGLPTPAAVTDRPVSPVVRGALAAAHIPHRLLARRYGVTFRYLFMRPDGQQLATLAELLDAGAVTPIVDAVYTFAQTPEALAYVARGRTVGKVVISMDDAAEHSSAG